MSEQNATRLPELIPDPVSEGGLRAPPDLSAWGKFWWWFRFAILVKLARLRFIAILAAIGLLIVNWNVLVAYYAKWTRPLRSDEQAADSEYEYYCTMHPNFVTENPKEKCPICAMNLTRRKKGKAAQVEALPPGVVDRRQLTPYQVVSAGIRTYEINYEPLVKHIETVGTVEFDERKLHRISARVKGRIDKLYVNVTGDMIHVGQPLADIYSPDLVTTVQNLRDAQSERDKELIRTRLRLWGVEDDQIKEMERATSAATHVTVRSRVRGYVRKKYQVEGEYVEESAPLFDVADESAVWAEAQVYERDLGYLALGLPVTATTEALPGKEFPGRILFFYPHLDQASRTLRVRFDITNPSDFEKHPETALRPGMFATVRIDVSTARLAAKFPSREGRVLAVPESAVVYTGGKKLVYRQEAPTRFEAVLVELGPLIVGPDDEGFYPVLKGLQPGERVVTTGSYLLDAENRVSAAAGSIYYGGTGASSKSGTTATADVRPTTPEDEALMVQANLAKLSTPDRRLVETQKICPIQKARLGGKMGVPVKLLLKGHPVFLCCKGCVEEAEANPDKTLTTVEKLKKGEGVPAGGGKGLSPEKEAKIKANLAKLSPEDRRLAEAQKYCVVQQDKRLGVMGKPVKIEVMGRPVFLCCAGCVDEAKEDPDRTLATAEKQKARAKAEAGK
jgi:RND family efflux transporter MFP subunit